MSDKEREINNITFFVKITYHFWGTHRHIGHIVFILKLLFLSLLKEKTRCPMCLCVPQKKLLIKCDIIYSAFLRIWAKGRKRL